MSLILNHHSTTKVFLSKNVQKLEIIGCVYGLRYDRHGILVLLH